MADPNRVFQKLCHEAVLACGPEDIAAIEIYVMTRIETMDAKDRERVRRELDLVLSYRSPETRPAGSH